MKPRERAGQDSIAKRRTGRPFRAHADPEQRAEEQQEVKVGEKPAMKLQIEYHRMEIISGVLRPMRSAIQPAAVAPTSRSHKVNVKTMATAVMGTSNSLAIGTMISRKMVKSNASSVQPSQAAM